LKRLAGEKQRVVILGGGFGGAFAAQELLRRGDSDLEVVLIDRQNFLLFYPLLIEAGVGAIEPRHVVVPLRKFMPKGDFRMADVLDVDTQLQQVTYRVVGRDMPEPLHYDHLVFALGSVTKMPPIPGLHEHGFEMKSLADAIEQRDRAIRLLELANRTPDPVERRALLTFVVVGANFTGVELAGEYHAFVQDLTAEYPNVSRNDVRMLLLEYADRILPALSEPLRRWSHDTLEKRGVEILTKTSVSEIAADHCVLTTGERIPTHTVVWTAGIAPPPILKRLHDFPVNEKGYLRGRRTLQLEGLDNVWAVGDAVTVFNEEGKPYAATAQNASRMGPLVARNILASLRGEDPKEFAFDPLGSFAAIGHRQAAADFLGRNVTGFFGWLMYRGTYLMKMPTFAMKARLFMDWLLEFFLRAEPVQLGVHRPALEVRETESVRERAQLV